MSAEKKLSLAERHRLKGNQAQREQEKKYPNAPHTNSWVAQFEWGDAEEIYEEIIETFKNKQEISEAEKEYLSQALLGMILIAQAEKNEQTVEKLSNLTKQDLYFFSTDQLDQLLGRKMLQEAFLNNNLKLALQAIKKIPYPTVDENITFLKIFLLVFLREENASLEQKCDLYEKIKSTLLEIESAIKTITENIEIFLFLSDAFFKCAQYEYIVGQEIRTIFWG